MRAGGLRRGAAAVASAVLCAAVALASPSRAEIPAYVRDALGRFPVELPPGLAYTVEAERNGERSVERYDPSQPAGARWQLLSREGREPTARELEFYASRSRDPADRGYRASFRPDQVDLGSLQLVRESATHATVRGGFHPAAVELDQMLGHLELTLLLRKQPAAVLSYRLELRGPYSPVLGVTMHELDAGAEFDAHGRPTRSWSRFAGRMFLKSMSEHVRATYRDFGPTPGPPDASPAGRGDPAGGNRN